MPRKSDETDSVGSAVQPALQVGARPDSMPTEPISSSLAWLVAGVLPDENAAVVPVAPADVSIAEIPANSSALMWVSAEEG